MAGRSRTNVPATIYNDFQPQIERKEEQEANTLIIHLPDFPKEQINVTYVDSSRSIKIQAERAVERNTRSRFNAAFPVPENCVIEKIQGSFRNGVLTITMPKRTINQLPLESPKHVNVPKQTTTPKSNTPKPAAPARASTSTSTSAIEKQKDQKVQSPQPPPKPKTEPKPPMASVPQTAPSPKDQQTKGKKVEALPPVKQQEETPRKVAPIAKQQEETPRKVSPIAKQQEETPRKVAPIAKQQEETPRKVSPIAKQQEETPRKVSPIAKQTEEKTVGSTSTVTRPQVEKKGETKDGLRDIVKEKNKDSIPEPEAKIPKTSEKAGVEKKPKEGGGGGFLEKAKEIKGANTIMKTVKKLATDDQEDRQLLINIGVSVLVIVALGAYITYSYRSSGKNKN